MPPEASAPEASSAFDQVWCPAHPHPHPGWASTWGGGGAKKLKLTRGPPLLLCPHAYLCSAWVLSPRSALPVSPPWEPVQLGAGDGKGTGVTEAGGAGVAGRRAALAGASCRRSRLCESPAPASGQRAAGPACCGCSSAGCPLKALALRRTIHSSSPPCAARGSCWNLQPRCSLPSASRGAQGTPVGPGPHQLSQLQAPACCPQACRPRIPLLPCRAGGQAQPPPALLRGRRLRALQSATAMIHSRHLPLAVPLVSTQY